MGIGIRQKPVQNIPQTLATLRRIDPDLRKRVPNEIKAYAQPMLAEIRAGMPARLTDDWTRKGRLGYRPSSARYKTTLQFRGAKPKNAPADSWPILRVRSKHLAMIIASTARKSHTVSGMWMIRKLNQDYGRADRFIWPVVEKHTKNIERGIRDSFRRYEKIINRELERRS